MLTSPDNIWSPDTGTEFKPTIDLAAMAGSMQLAIDGFRADLSVALSNIPNRGVFSNSTSRSGTATVTHSLGSVPSQFFAFDLNTGAIPARRKIVGVTASTTQIQFAVYDPDTGGLLASNPVSFFWMAFR